MREEKGGREELETLSGTVEHVTFRNSDNGFTVLDLNTGTELVAVVGNLPELAPGESLELTGRYDVHPTFGPQFKAELCERKLPSTAAAILRYLSSGGIKGIGPSTARRIVDAFGDRALEVIEQEPERLARLKGISLSKAHQFREELVRQFGLREVVLFLSQYGVTPDEAVNVYKQLGPGCVDKLKANPYYLCGEGIRFAFDRVDQMAASLGFAKDFSFRVTAGIEYVLRHNLGNGHTCLPRDRLAEVAESLLQVDRDLVDITCDQMTAGKTLASVTIGGREFLFLPHLYRAESYCASRISLMLDFPPAHVGDVSKEIDRIESELNIKYEALQREAITAALSRGVLILTGGPGTGKTTTLNAIIRLMEKQGMKIALAAPTGRAAKRMSDLTGCEAKTLHRLLEVEWSSDDRASFMRNEQNPLDCDAVIVDELSMVDVTLFESLLRALRLGCRLILVGDSDQLPSVGAGNVLQDLIESGRLPTVELKEVFRQALRSVIVTNAHKIVRGEDPELGRKDADFFFLQQRAPLLAARTVCDLCVTRLPAAYGLDPFTDIQVLCPSRKRDTGTQNLNNLLQERLNPADGRKRELPLHGYRLREGDKVMQVRNNYDIAWEKSDGQEGSGVFNGDVGVLESVDRAAGLVSVRFDDRLAYYTGDDAEQLELAYAVTVHKSQGSEFECVVLPVLDMPAQLRYRNLLYTAVTRAKRLLILVGAPETVHEMVANDRRTRRYTALKTLLEEGASHA